MKEKHYWLLGGIIVGLVLGAAGLANAATVLFPTGGGTGTSTPPILGQLLVGNSGGTYSLQATSTLGLGNVSASSLTSGLLVQSTGPNTIANIATSSLGLLTTNVAEGTNLYFTNARADARINATSTISTLTSAPNLGTVSTALSGILKASSGVLSAAVAGTDYFVPSAFGSSFYTFFHATTTDALAEGTTNLYFTNAHAIASLLTGYTSGAGTISASDSILSAIQKLNGNIAALVTGVSSFNTRTGAITLNSGDVTTALGFTPYNATNPSGFISNITGLVTQGTNVTVTGAGTSGSPYVINSIGGGGSGGGTWATTTSSVAGQLINYSLNNTDIVTVGSSSTTTAPVWFDPNKLVNYFKGAVGIGSTSPYMKLVVSGPTYIGVDGLTSTTQATGLNTYVTDLNTNALGVSMQSLGSLSTGGSFQSVQFNATDNGGNAVNTIQGLNGLAIKSVSGSAGTLIAIQGSARLSGAATATTLEDYRAQSRFPAGTAASTSIAFSVIAPSSGGTVVNSYGFKTVAQKVAGVTNGYGFASDGASDINYVLGTLGVGTSSPGSNLAVQGNELLTGTLTIPGTADGCATWASGVLGTTGTACGTGSGGITALTGDITASGPGSAAATLATVNGNVGSFTNASITVNAKGLITAASNGTAPVTSVIGTTNRITSSGGTTPAIDIAATYAGQSSITTLGTITTGVWNGTAIANANLANSTISGVALGGTLNTLSATNATLTFSGSYTGAAAQTVALNTTNPNTWTGLQQFNANASTTALTVSGNEWLTALATPTGSFLAVNQFGQIIATTSPSGGSTITLSGDVSGSGTTAITTVIGPLKVLGSMIAAATIDLTTKVTGILPFANGGTGFGTYTTGDTLYASAANTLSKLGIGASSTVMVSNGTIPSWVPFSSMIPQTSYQIFTASGTWTKPTGLIGNEMCKIQVWGGGGGGGNTTSSGGSGGGGGGDFIEVNLPCSGLGSSETITIGTGGTAQNAGNNTTFGTEVTAFGGGPGTNSGSTVGSGGGGGGGSLATGGSGSGTTGGVGGTPGPGPGGTGSGMSGIGYGGWGGGGGGGGGSAVNGAVGGTGAYGGGGGGGGGGNGNAGGVGGKALWGGGGGGGGTNNGTGLGGTSLYGGAGGAGGISGSGSNGTAPAGGGGGANAAGGVGGTGARGEVRIWVIRS